MAVQGVLDWTSEIDSFCKVVAKEYQDVVGRNSGEPGGRATLHCKTGSLVTVQAG